MRRGPSAFAPSKLADGRSLTWEGLKVVKCWTPVNTALSVAFTVGTSTVLFDTLIPQNVTRGVVTLERIRGQMLTLFNNAAIVSEGFDAACLHASIQLLPIVEGVFDASLIIQPTNLLGLESNRLIWRRTWWPEFGNTLGGSTFIPSMDRKSDVDIKSRRRFDRALFALVLAVEVDTAVVTNIHVAYDFRALFRAPDGV